LSNLIRGLNRKFTGMVQALVDQMEKTGFNDYSFEERLGLLVEYEWTYRQNKRLAILLKQTKLCLEACMEDINYTHPRKLDRKLMKSLATCQWINARHNAIITGPTGIGKTFIACALANAACRLAFTARYYRRSSTNGVWRPLIITVYLLRGKENPCTRLLYVIGSQTF